MKQFLLLCALMFTTPLFASGIDAGETSAPCDNTTLETYGGTANVEINWEPNTIQTRWYNGNTLIDTTNTNADSCVYDDVLNVPPTPTNRTGYTFNGWTVRPEMDFSTIPLESSAVERWSEGEIYDTHEIRCYHNGRQESCTSGEFFELQVGEWKTLFNHGMVYGMSKCSAKGGTSGVATNFTDNDLDSVAGDKSRCWCRVTGYKANNSDIIYAPLSILSWVLDYYYDDNARCLRSCSNACAAQMWEDSRTALFTPAANN